MRSIQMDRYEDSMFDELGFEEGEVGIEEFDEGGEADEYEEDDQPAAFDEGDEFEEYDEGDEGDEFEQPMDFDEGDEFEEYDEGEEEFDEEALDEAMAYALGAEDSDEFFRRIARGVRGAVRAVRRAAPTIGRIARTVGRVASVIPLPQAQAIGRVANVVGQLMADEASEDEALDAFAEAAVRNRAARPVAAALAVRRAIGPRAAARMPAQAGGQAVPTPRQAATQLQRRAGPTAIRALPRIARSVRRAAATRGTPPQQRARVLQNAAMRAIRRGPRLRRQLSQPLPAGRRVIRRAQAAAQAGVPPAQRILGRGAAFGGIAGAPLGGLGRGRRRIIVRQPSLLIIRPL
jgi:hypothetical protein